jgi:hypothetical protein
MNSDMDRITTEERRALDDVFTYHAPNEEQKLAYSWVREGAKAFAATILARVPSCPDRTIALRKIREAVMDANAAIALEGRGLPR